MQRNIRLFFSKTDRAKYISHLDMMRCWTRAFNRAELPMWYTEGYNPHLYMTFLLPLSLGFESLCECIDARLIDDVPLDEVQRQINAALPEGIRVSKVDDIKMNQKEIQWSDYEVRLECKDPGQLLESMREHLGQSEIVVPKKSKKGMVDVDIAPHFRLLESSAEEGTVCLRLRMATGITLNVNPMLLIDSFARRADILHAHYRRVAVLTGELQNFE